MASELSNLHRSRRNDPLMQSKTSEILAKKLENREKEEDNGGVSFRSDIAGTDDQIDLPR